MLENGIYLSLFVHYLELKKIKHMNCEKIKSLFICK